jgi:pyrimidine deaminase RibD-like protein
MRRALELAKNAQTEASKNVASPRVAAVAVAPDGSLLLDAFRGELDPGDHAEFVLISKAQKKGISLAGATIYTTLEPCTERNEPKVPCARRLIEAGVSTVFIGMMDPDGRIRERGYEQLNGAGVAVWDFDSETREKLLELNAPFIERFRTARGLEGTITFDYMQNDGVITIEAEGRHFSARWTQKGKGSVYAYGSPGTLDVSRTAKAFDEIDDPDRFEYKGHSHGADVGQIVILRSEDGHVLFKIESVLAGQKFGDPRTELVLSYEVRLLG